ncbi:MAG: alpha/beta fold hydrolase, partial [Actinomycetes bacterium]
VLLLHGLAHNQSWSVKIARELKAAGFAPQPIEYQTFSLTIDECADLVAEQILDVATSSRSTAVHAAGHSLGGLVLRAAINRHPELDDIVATGITIGTPNEGTPWAFTGARLIPRVGKLIEEIRPGSETLAIIDEQTRSSDTEWVSIYSSLDQMVPGHYGRLDHPRMRAKNYELGGLGHFGITSNPVAVETIVDCLARADACHTPAVRLPRQQTRPRLAMTV